MVCAIIFETSCKKDPVMTTVEVHDTVFITPAAADTTAQGYILLSPFTTTTDTGTLMVLDGNGKLLKQKQTPGAAFDFRRWVVNGQVRYTWSTYDPNGYVIPVAGDFSFYNVIADSNLTELKRVSLIAHGDISTDLHQGDDLHDFIYLSDNHYLTLSYYQKMVKNVPDSLSPGGSGNVVCPVIQEISNDQVIWQWEGSDHPEFYGASVQNNNFTDPNTPQDYMHMNSMFIDPTDDNLIVSCRNLDQVVKIDRKSGEIIWRLGGKNSDFPMSDDQQFLRQHHATLADNNKTLLLFDNGEASIRPYSRILEFQLDQPAKLISGYRSFNIPEQFSQIMGNVQKFGTRYFIGGGSARYYLDVNYLTGIKYREKKLPMQCYRVFRSLE
jgi:hypothetical protein